MMTADQSLLDEIQQTRYRVGILRGENMAAFRAEVAKLLGLLEEASFRGLEIPAPVVREARPNERD